MTSALLDVCCASFAPECLAMLAEVRCVPGVRVARGGERTWLRWQAGDERVLRQVLPIPGARFYLLRKDSWFRHGHHLPAFEVPADLDWRPLAEVLTPVPVQPVPPPAWNGSPVTLTLVADQCPRPTTAVLCDLEVLAAWADTIPALRLAGLQAACFQERILLLGTRLPLLLGSERFWGARVLVPVGFRLDPSLPESGLHRALGLAAEEMLLVRPEKTEVLPLAVFQPLTRAGLRLASREVGP